MEIKNLLIYRQQLIDESKDEEGYISDSGFVNACIPAINETKHIDTTDLSDTYCNLEGGVTKVNAYTLSESEERLQLFVVNEDFLQPGMQEENALISQKSIYEKQFLRTMSFLKKAIKRQLDDQLQNGSTAWILAHQLGSSVFIDQIDVVEIFLLSASVTVERRGNEVAAKTISFDEENITVNFTRDKQRYSKDLLIVRRLIDVNFLYNVYEAQGNRDPLIIDFSAPPFNEPLSCLHAASEAAFDSYLCALPGTLLAELYRRHSSRLLEKNVRSFLQLKGVNKGMQDTIRREPEKFIAYNNGLTITATSSELVYVDGAPRIKSLSDFQIVNGGQTTATLYFSQKYGLNIKQVRVMAKINVAKNADEEALDELISNISTFSNAQSRVSKVDLRARSPQLVKVKSLSESVLTVSGKQWFFERAKGEYATLLRINSGRKSIIEKKFPKERRFSKEDMAKYYAAWGDKPHAVKKGGEKIFRLFIEELSGEGKSKKAVQINRSFYEDLIARIILFRSLEKIYGAGNNAIGQIRSAVVPYALSVVYSYTTGNKKARPFDLFKIWKSEKIESDLEVFFKDLMILMNGLIKTYSKSDDLGEYSKKAELWEDIIKSSEIETFINNAGRKEVISKYTISPDELKKREKDSANLNDLNFEYLSGQAAIFDKGENFYSKILSTISGLSASKTKKVENLIYSIQQCQVIDEGHVQFERDLVSEVVKSHSEVLDEIENNGEETFTKAVSFVIKRYNQAVTAGQDIQSAFDIVKEMAKKKDIKYYSVFGEIGRLLKNGELPTMIQLKQIRGFTPGL